METGVDHHFGFVEFRHGDSRGTTRDLLARELRDLVRLRVRS